jgi:glycosyltransferase involved in cell wall biosynthesis
MKILEANKFFFDRGGAEAYFFDVRELLKQHGHEVMDFSMNHPKNKPSLYQKYFVKHVDFEKSGGLMSDIATGLHLLWSIDAAHKLERLIEEQGKPDVAHLQNIYYHLTPSIVYILRKYDIPIVWTLHDYKNVSPNYNLYSHGQIDESTKPDKYYKALFRKSIKDSYVKTALAVCDMYLHKKITKLYDKADIFISPSIFLKKKMVEYGMKEGQFVHLYNFIHMDHYVPEYTPGEEYIFVGRWVEEKGVMQMIDAFISMPDKKLTIIGAGEMSERMKSLVAAHNATNITIVGPIYAPEMYEYVRKAKALIIPSIWYENNPIIILQAMALGKPVLGSDRGGVPELIEQGVTGFTFDPMSLRAWKDTLDKFEASDIEQMGRNARRYVETIASPKVHYEQLMEIFQKVIKSKTNT